MARKPRNTRGRPPVHGHNRKNGRTATYYSWACAKARCCQPSNPSYPRYGGAGITMCRRWRRSFAAFLADMGVRPPGKTLDRKDNRLGYNKNNCRWCTPAEQNANRSLREPGEEDDLDPPAGPADPTIPF